MFAVLIDGMVLTGPIHGFNLRELILAPLDSPLIFVFGLFGAIRNACHSEKMVQTTCPQANRGANAR